MFLSAAPPAGGLSLVEEHGCPKASQTTIAVSPAAPLSEPQAIRAGAGTEV